MQIALTALVTILVGALTLVVGQIIVRGAVEPALDLKRLIGTIAHDLDFYANRFSLATHDEQQEWRDRFRKYACSLREKLTVIIWYPILGVFFNYRQRMPFGKQPSVNRVLKSSSRTAVGAFTRRQIKELLRIKT